MWDKTEYHAPVQWILHFRPFRTSKILWDLGTSMISIYP